MFVKRIDDRWVYYTPTLEQAQECVGKGWAGLVKKFYDAAIKENARIEQIKEKFGGLRIYATGSKELYNLIDDLEKKSYTICEECGEPGEPDNKGWIKTVCSLHKLEREKNST
jgi:hypothetical protein